VASLEVATHVIIRVIRMKCQYEGCYQEAVRGLNIHGFWAHYCRFHWEGAANLSGMKMIDDINDRV